ncbi:helix-turn-helix transcriptional regulator [Haloferax sp. DFSO52]|uniref:helix-turn-helix transcriptional regulator n=1 Tax=Haloferax sp. DFSO52 TaxID=3388505 RepID=UPI003A8AD1D8
MHTSGGSQDENDDVSRTPSASIVDALLDNARNRRHLGQRLAEEGDRVSTEELVDIVRHRPLLELLLDGPRDRREIEERLDVSKATSHRFTQWLDTAGLGERIDHRVQLTGRGTAIAEELLRFEANVRTAHRLTPLLDAICDDHDEFFVEPFVDATVTTAEPEDPYRPVERFIELARASRTLRGFNTTHMAPLVLGEFHQQVFEETETELIYLPSIVEKLFETYPEHASEAIERGHLTLRTRDELPYGLVLFDDRIGIGGYDRSTGLMQVFVDTDAPIARQWGERVYESLRADSEPFDSRA